jgi:lysophospholipase L1-like esterase
MAANVGETVRQVAHMAGGGERLRVRLSNRYGRAPLVIGAARVALRKTGAAIVPETDTALRFGGAERVTIPAGREAVSDDIEVAVRAGDDLAVSLYFPEPTGPATFSPMVEETGYVVAGDRTAAADLTGPREEGSRFFLTGIDVLAPVDTPVVVAFGDSWFAGSGTTLGANRRSVDMLNVGLRRGWVVNQGIPGNRLLTDEVGECGLRRFDRDVLGVPGVRQVVVNLGINDLALREVAAARDLIAGYRELAERTHAAGLTVFVNTIGPFAGVIYPGVPVAAALPVRRVVNDWLRAATVFDGVFDVAAAVADRTDPDFIRPEFDSGDGLHLNDRGARVMAEAMRLPLAR